LKRASGTFNATFENCLIDPSALTATGPAVQASNYAPVDPDDPGYQALATPFARLSFIRCYLGSRGSYVFVGMGTGSGLRVVDTIWGGGTPFDASSLSALSEYSDSAQMSAVLALVQLVTNASGQMVNKPIGNGVNTTVVNPFAPRAEIQLTTVALSGGGNVTGPTAPFWLSGIVGGWDGQVIEIVNLSGQQMSINHLDPTEAIAANQFMCSNGPPGVTLASAPGGFGWVRVSYSGSKSKWLVLDHS
jgi:hypothetical protein